MVDLRSSWPADQEGLLAVFDELRVWAAGKPGLRTAIVTRPGISHSLRASTAVLPLGRSRPVFFLIDVVVSDADPWFLSVCFYEDEITDPEERGNPIPLGLYDETGYCFDVDGPDDGLVTYIKIRVDEAYSRAA